MSTRSITDYSAALDFLKNDWKSSTLIRFWIPKEKFVELLIDESGVSICREDNGKFVFALGKRAPLRLEWSKISFERSSSWLKELTKYEKNEWEAYSLHVPSEPRLELTEEPKDEEIADFLKEHGRDLSVSPGNPEIVRWSSIRSDSGELEGVAAICKWQSGEHVVASVVTDSARRNKGLGKHLMKVVSKELATLGIKQVCLGVTSSNLGAVKLYQNIGYEKLFDFTFINKTSS
ncbi:MAG: GNAT family N-acetyltransferase [Actinobacteria bacterium]|nr:GNAT family N-acetyltransferase [Actinomycetota bacterium]